MESTIAEDFLNDLAELSEEDMPTKKQKLDFTEALETSKILGSVELECILNLISQATTFEDSKFLEDCSNMIVEIDSE